MKRFSVLVVLAATLVCLLLAAPAFASVTEFTMTGPVGVQQEGNTVVFEAQATGGAPMYEFWLRPASGSWGNAPAQVWSTQNTFEIQNLQAGSYVVAAYAIDQADIDAGNWDAKKEMTYPVYVGSTITLNATYSSDSINLVAASTGITDPVYEFWYDNGSGAWPHTGYTESATYSIENAAGTYTMIVYVKERVALDHYTQAIWSDVQTINTDDQTVTAQADVAVGSGAMSSFKTITVKPVAGLAGAAKFKVSDGVTTSAAKDLGSSASYMTSAASVTVTILAADGSTVLGTGTLNVSAAAADLAFTVTLTSQPEQAAVCTVAVGAGAMSSFKTITVVSTNVAGAVKFKVSDGVTTSAAKDIGSPASYMTSAESVTLSILAADDSVLGTGTLSVNAAVTNESVTIL